MTSIDLPQYGTGHRHRRQSPTSTQPSTKPGCCTPAAARRPHVETVAPGPKSTRGQVRIPAGSFAMGDAFAEGHPDDGERPVHEVYLSSYWIDATTVTNAQFASFVKATGYVTTAERAGFSAVFHLALFDQAQHVRGAVADAPWWLMVDGACWRAPEGPGLDISQRANHPAVHVSYEDAVNYAAWAGKRLPTEAEWERAARGGLEGSRYAWGDELTPRGRHRCNIWQGEFPTHNTVEDGYLTTAPVKTYAPNGFGLYQVAGNAWEWCADWFDADYYSHSPDRDPRGPETGEARAIRGGSFLCHDSYCNRYRVAARSSAPPESTSMNLGFRCANDA